MLPKRMLFDDFLDDFEPLNTQKNMLCDIYEENNNYIIEVDVPGFRKEDISIECNKGNLKITAEKQSDDKTDKKYVHRERRSYERCERSFYLGNIEEDNIKAEFKEGILKITVPKEKENNTKKKINID